MKTSRKIIIPAVLALYFSVSVSAAFAGDGSSSGGDPDSQCNNTPGCGGAGPCEPGTTCRTGDCDPDCPKASGYECGTDKKWWLTGAITSTCGTICGEKTATYMDIQGFKWVENSICGKCSVMVTHLIQYDSEAAETPVPCTNNARPPVTTVTTLPCLLMDSVDTYSNPNGIGDATPPGTRYAWDHDTLIDTGCDSPSRGKGTDAGCMQGNFPCSSADPGQKSLKSEMSVELPELTKIFPHLLKHKTKK